jgi:hypothetical protein
MRSDIVPGNALPDYELRDHTGNLRKLSAFQGGDPLIRTLARGQYCPKEPQQDLEGGISTPNNTICHAS